MSGLQQSTVIIITLMVMFFVFITLKGELGAYLEALGFRKAA